MLLPCDFCSSKPAVLCCRADSAKLCLFCDQQVHSANALSSKHFRSPICDNCKAEPVSVRCSTHNLMLCQDCDHDCHNNNNNSSVSSLHECNPVEGFSGCPSAIQLAYVFGFDLKAGSLLDLSYGSCMLDHETVNFQDFTVPEGNSSVSSVFLTCEREKQEVYEQLVEMGKRDVVRVSGDGAELSPGTPPSSGCGQQGNLESLAVGDGNNEELMQQQMPFTSLLMLSNNVGLRESDSVTEGDLMRDCDPAYEAAQIWDFQMGRSRDCEEPGPQETRSGANNFDLMIKNYSGLTKETSMTTTTKVLQTIYKMNCSSVCVDNLSSSNYSNQPSSSNATTTEERNTIPVIGSLPESRNVLVMEQPLLAMREASRGAKPTVDLEMLAQNRGNAMLRYKEKKKTRRFDKRIRYESRKARADTRKRVKGRFVKASESLDVEV